MNETSTPWKVLGCNGCGSAIVEAALVLAGIPYEREEVDYSTQEGHDRLSRVNPLAQVPTVVLPDGTVMTESAALVLYIDGLVPELGLVPSLRDPLRREFLRWLMFLVAAVYPTFTYGDEPAKWTPDGAEELRQSTDDHRKALWRLVEGAVRGPWFLGERPSALDLYVSVMTRWRPRREWFAENCPRLHKIAVAVDEDARLTQVWTTNFSDASAA
ncbi:MAG TPA: glutathione S-transferase family protein [Kofleriaceae bacterium]|nr:glutathione S-transferase family protein [Kofleriaceae bacterium]